MAWCVPVFESGLKPLLHFRNASGLPRGSLPPVRPQAIAFALANTATRWQESAAMPDEGVQGEFFFVEGWPAGEAPALPPSLDEEIAAAWRVPVGKRVHVSLRQHDMPGTSGLLEITRAPDWPFNPRRPLALRIGLVGFPHQ